MLPSRNGNNPLDRFHDIPLQRGTAPLWTYLCENKQNKNNVKSLYFPLFCEAVMTPFTFATASTFVRPVVCTFEACAVAKMTLSLPLVFPRIAADHTFPVIKEPAKELNWNLSPHSAPLVVSLGLYLTSYVVICSHLTWWKHSWCSLYSRVQCTLSRLRNTVHIYQVCLNTPLIKNTDNTSAT